MECCEWDGQGNGHYLTSCGDLIYDKGRLIKAQNKYGAKIKPIPIYIKCPTCGKKIKDR